jgi:Skp family chaperone for outer membrane proteins|tara:strand:+ start:332 stop:520 length:189 start_codon:yes stop_codon:yes gene_type:complete
MPQLGSDERPVMFRKAIVNKDSRFRKHFDKKKYDDNYDRIFRKKEDMITTQRKLTDLNWDGE